MESTPHFSTPKYDTAEDDRTFELAAEQEEKEELCNSPK
jgi:hypothetical protein